jgi:hypothetical protein
LGGRHRRLRQIWVDLKVQPRRPSFDAAQHQMFDGIEADHAAGDRFSNSSQHIVETKHLQQAHDLDELALARLAQTGLEQTAQGRELVRQNPSGQRRGLVQRADLPFQQRRVVQRIEDEVLALVGAWRAISSAPQAITTSWT